jgi:hypothetical protein
VDTEMVPSPPVAGSSGVLLVADTSHLLVDGSRRFVLEEPHPAATHAAKTSPRKIEDRTTPRVMQSGRRQEFIRGGGGSAATPPG